VVESKNRLKGKKMSIEAKKCPGGCWVDMKVRHYSASGKREFTGEAQKKSEWKPHLTRKPSKGPIELRAD